ncbi:MULTISPECIES: HAD-IIB family hydrolase [Vibrio]|uniref:HAD-IIB family hydrolase n=1 Tax=Vibrio TaxID=662 RepID=UPI00076A4A9B|nr:MULTISPECIES: HAD-IIB family hydrolase [Vibrio]MBB1462570.1 HAD-IIB family hydrolase [Vibrio sp. SG41-7]MCC4859609.1 HAD-IIB family hydrolase [Vibrio splendidus]MCT4350348.1 HAD-IIB family hydrolase [Vibrio sp. NC2]PHX08479.1 phosphoglycolate phosphatase [Vibrio splendidus]SBS60853.1 phosphoglycolate phosphatase [Vibrio splendidus]
MEHQLGNDWQHINWVLTDVDDTLTWQGSLPPETLIALQKLRDNGIKVVAVTGACAGWCDHIAQLWPVDAVLGENGAFLLEKQDGALQLSSETPLEQVRKNQAKLKQEVEAILLSYPDLSLTLDQSYRLCEVAIDIGQNRKPVDPETVQAVLERIHALGAHATASSIHINAWYGEHSKKNAVHRFLTNKGLSLEQIHNQACYVGDSMNDQQMFESLPLTVGVANIKHYWDKLDHHPSKVMSQPGGYGFAEFVDALLAVKS